MFSKETLSNFPDMHWKDLTVLSKSKVIPNLTFDGPSGRNTPNPGPSGSQSGPSLSSALHPNPISEDLISRKRVKADISSENEKQRLRSAALNAKTQKSKMSFSSFRLGSNYKNIAAGISVPAQLKGDGALTSSEGEKSPSPPKSVTTESRLPTTVHSSTVVVDVSSTRPVYFRNSGELISETDQEGRMGDITFSPAFMKRFALTTEDVKVNSVPGWLWEQRGFMVSWECRHDPSFLAFCEQNGTESELCFALGKELRLACSRHFREEMIPAVATLKGSDNPMFARAIVNQLKNKQLGFMYTEEDEQACRDLIERLTQFIFE